MESKFCPLTNQLYMMAYEELGRTLVKRKFSTLNILTLGNKWIIGFGCEGHPDVNDWFGILDDVGEKIESYMNELSNHNSKRSAFIDTFGTCSRDVSKVLSGKKRKREIELQKSRNAYTINASCIRHLKMLRDLQKDKGWYEKPTTCGYKFFDWRQNKSSHENIYAFFLHTALGIAVELKTDIFNWFRSARHIHQTAVPVIYNEKTDVISFQNSEWNILAWGSGTISSTTQKKRRKFYIQNKGIGWDLPNLRVTQELFRNFFIDIQTRPNGDDLVARANELELQPFD